MNYIIGTGNFGIIVREFLERNKITVSGFIELNPSASNLSHDNLPIVPLQKINKNDVLFIGSNRYNHKWIQREFSGIASLRFADKYLNVEEVENINFSPNLKWNIEKVEDEMRYYFVIRRNFSEKKKDLLPIILNSLDVVVTEKCTLKCVDCSNLMQYYERPKNADGVGMIENLNKLLDATYVNSLRFIGGEPLVNKSLASILDSVCSKWKDKFTAIEIYTNGTLLPSPDLISVCKQNPVTFYISDYGSKSPRLEDVVSLLKENDIRFSVESNLIWHDCGRVLPYYSENIEYKYANCCTAKTFSLLDDYLYDCPFAANFHNLYDDEKRTDRDCIYLPNLNKSQLTERLRKMQLDESPLTACYYCKGRDYSTELVEVAKQTKKILIRPLHVVNDYS